MDIEVGEADKLNVGTPATVKVIFAAATRVPEVPVTVTVVVPSAADAPALSVNALVFATAPRVKLAVTPAGSAEVVNTTVPLKPLAATTERLLLADDPWTRPMLAGEADTVKPEGARTVRIIANVLRMVPDFPVSVMVELPGTAELDADMVSAPALAPPREAGLKVAVIPACNPEALRATVPEKPFSGVTEMVAATLIPGVTESAAGFDAIVKEGEPWVPVS